MWAKSRAGATRTAKWASQAWNVYKLTGFRVDYGNRDPRPWYRHLPGGIGVRADLNWRRWVVGVDWHRLIPKVWRPSPLVVRLYLGPVIADLEFAGNYYEKSEAP